MAISSGIDTLKFQACEILGKGLSISSFLPLQPARRNTNLVMKPLTIESRANTRTESAEILNRRMKMKFNGTPTKPRLSVFCSHKQLYAMLVDDQNKKCLFYGSTLQKSMKKGPSSTASEAAERVGEELIKTCVDLNISEISTYDRNGLSRGERMQAFEIVIGRHGFLPKNFVELFQENSGRQTTSIKPFDQRLRLLNLSLQTAAKTNSNYINQIQQTHLPYSSSSRRRKKTMDRSSEGVGIKIYTSSPQLDPPSLYPSTAADAAPNSSGGGRKRRAMANGVQKTLSKTSMLANFLPTGTLLTFEMVLPSIYANGSCTHVTTHMIYSLLLLCTLSCFFFHFTDSFRGTDGKLYYGFVTPRGLAVFKPGLGVEVPREDKYKVGLSDFVHAMMSALVFVAIALSDHRVTGCVFPGHKEDLDEVMQSFPLMVGIICSGLFLVFPTTRYGIGCAAA